MTIKASKEIKSLFKTEIKKERIYVLKYKKYFSIVNNFSHIKTISLKKSTLNLILTFSTLSKFFAFN